MNLNDTPKAITLTRRSPMIERIEAESDETLSTIVEFIVLVSLVAILIIAFFAPSSAHGAERWTERDTAVEVAFVAIVAIDYSQTRWTLNQPTGEEYNPLLGKHPSQGRLIAGCLASVGLHAAITHVLPREWRTVWQTISIAVEVANVGMNMDRQYRTWGGIHFAF